MKRKLFLLCLFLLSAFTLALTIIFAVAATATAQTSDRPAPTATPGYQLEITGTGSFLITDVVLIAPPAVVLETAAATRQPLMALGATQREYPILQDAEKEIQPLWVELMDRQQAYYQIYGEYWQGSLILPGAKMTATVTTETPSDNHIPWVDFMGGEFPYHLPVALRCDVYNSPAGPGFVLVAQAGGLEMSRGYGPLDTSHGWRSVVVYE